jgi:hypothetical protein
MKIKICYSEKKYYVKTIYSGKFNKERAVQADDKTGMNKISLHYNF